MIDAVRYLVDNGIKWRAMPCDFPPWPRVYAFFARWRDTGLVAELHDRLRGAVRDAESREEEPSAGVVDSQSVKADATVGNTSRGFDAGKKINGRKRHLLTDTLGLLLDVLVTPASTTDRDAARILLPVAKKHFRRLSRIWADGGCCGHLQDWAAQFGFARLLGRAGASMGYRVAMNEFLAGGGDGFAALGQGTNKLVGAFDLDLFNAYLAAHSTAAAPLAPPATDRITIIQ